MEVARQYDVHEAKTHFSRILVTQAQAEGLTPVSRDGWMRAYGVAHLPV